MPLAGVGVKNFDIERLTAILRPLKNRHSILELSVSGGE